MTHHEHHIVIWGVTKQEQEEARKWLLVPSVANCLPGQASQRSSSKAASREEFLESRGGSVFLDQLLVRVGLSCCLQGPGTVPVLVLLCFCRSEVLERVSPRWPQDWFFWKLISIEHPTLLVIPWLFLLSSHLLMCNFAASRQGHWNSVRPAEILQGSPYFCDHKCQVYFGIEVQDHRAQG